MKNTILKANLTIHCFALAHALTVILFRYYSIPDDIPLTVLTLAMVVSVGRIYRFPIDISAALALLFCFAGFYMGTKGAEMIACLSDGALLPYANVICTVVVTEILGWATVFITCRQKGKDTSVN